MYLRLLQYNHSSRLFQIILMIEWIIIYLCGIIGLAWAYKCGMSVLEIDVQKLASFGTEYRDLQPNIDNLIKIGEKISNGADAFLTAEYKIMAIFIVLFGALVFFIVDYPTSGESGIYFYATISYVIGSVTSMACGWIGMRIAVKSNFRTTFKAIKSLSEAFKTAYSAGCVMGFSMISISLIVLAALVQTYSSIFSPEISITSERSWAVLMEMLAGYGLGGSSIALFGRVGGGIYTKAADVGADLVGKVEEGLDEDSPRNPATIADNVGDNVGDIAGMGSDLFGSFAESTCAALVFIASTPDLVSSPETIAYPLLISAFGKIVLTRYHIMSRH